MSMRSADDIFAGARFGDLSIVEELGRGAFGVVYLATDTVLERRTALKVVRVPKSSLTSPVILEEARLIAQLRSPNVVTLYRAHALDEGAWAFEMEHVDGPNLREYLDMNGPMGSDQARRLLVDVLRGLGHAHQLSIVHRDIKPENVLIDPRGTAKLTDFGLGLRLGEAHLQRSQDGTIQGTPLYMAPETIASQEGSPTTDVWGVGVMGYELLTGQRPFHANTLPSLFTAIRESHLPPLPPGTPRDLMTLVRRCTEKSRSLRPKDANEAKSLLVQTAVDRAGTDAASRHRPWHLMGRDDELNVARGLLENLCHGQGGAMLVSGGMGAGKTAYLGEVSRRAGQLGIRVLSAHGMDTGGLEMALESQLSRADSSEREVSTSDSPAKLDARVGDAIGRSPVLVIVADIDTGDDDDIKLILSLVKRAARDRLAVVLSSRTQDVRSSTITSPGLVTRVLSEQNIARIQLGPIPDHHIRRIVEQRHPDRSFSEEALYVITSEASGNPMIALDLAHKADSEIVATDVRAERRALGITARFASVATSEMRRLSAVDRELLEFAAIDGEKLDGQILSVITDRSLLNVLRALHRITENGEVVRSTSTGFRFAHKAYRWAIYDSIAPALRRAIHRRFAGLLRDKPREHYTDFERIAFHLKRSGEDVEAANAYRVAARRAMWVQRPYTSIRLGREGGLFGDLTHEEVLADISPLISVASASLDTGNKEVAKRLLDQLRQAASACDDANAAAICTVWTADFAYFGGTEPCPTDEELLQAVGLLGISKEAGRGYYVLALRAKRAHDYERSLSLLDEAVTILEEANYPRFLSSAIHERGTALSSIGRSTDAARAFARSARLAHSHGSEFNGLTSDLLHAICLFESGEFEVARTGVQSCRARYEMRGNAAHASYCDYVTGKIFRASGDLKAAMQAAREASRGLARGDMNPPALDAALEWAELAVLVDAPGETQVAAAQISRLPDPTNFAQRLSRHITRTILANARRDGNTVDSHPDEIPTYQLIPSIPNRKLVHWKLTWLALLDISLPDDLVEWASDAQMWAPISAPLAQVPKSQRSQVGFIDSNLILAEIQDADWGPCLFERGLLAQTLSQAGRERKRLSTTEALAAWKSSIRAHVKSLITGETSS